MKTGGIVKFDLKAFTPSVYKALTDGEVDVALMSFKAAARRFRERPEVPLVRRQYCWFPATWMRCRPLD